MYFCNKVLSYSFSMNLRIQYNFFLCLQFSNSTSWWEDYSSENTGVTSSYTDSKKKKGGGGGYGLLFQHIKSGTFWVFSCMSLNTLKKERSAEEHSNEKMHLVCATEWYPGCLICSNTEFTSFLVREPNKQPQQECTQSRCFTRLTAVTGEWK